MTQDEAKQLAQSVDVDDMDASLFSSFQSQRRNSKPRNRYSESSVSRKSEPADSKRKEPVTKQIDREKVSPVEEAPVVGQMNHKGSSTKSTESKKSKLGIGHNIEMAFSFVM